GRVVALDGRALVPGWGGQDAPGRGCRARSRIAPARLGCDGSSPVRPGDAHHSDRARADDRWAHRTAHRASRAHARGDADHRAVASGGEVVSAPHALELLGAVMDPEVPVLSIIELGIVRGV